jgi:Uma2 family endonuclease
MAQRSRRTTVQTTTVYPVEEKMGEESLQRVIIELLRPLVERWLAHNRIKAFAGADQFIYFLEGDIRRRVAPDVYVLPGVRPGRRIKSWKTWEEQVIPSFALEVVSGDIDKDYIDAPDLYRQLGVKELVIFDPDFEESSERFRFQVYRQIARRGLVRVLVTDEDRVYSKTLKCHLRAIGAGETTRLRLATGPEGEALFPTEAEEERGNSERERAARIAAEQELARLRARLAPRRTRRRH